MKILYISHVDWNWIKQRPHFIAEELSKIYDVDILYRHNANRKGLQNRETKGIHKMYYIPFIGRFNFGEKINQCILKIFVQYYIWRFKSDLVYLTVPYQIELLPKWYKGNVIYDCMDDHISFTDDKAKIEVIKEQESRLVQRASVIIATSGNLSDKLKLRYENVASKIHIIRNGFNGEIYPTTQYQTRPDAFKIVYFGTVSRWFNFDFIIKVLNEIEGLSFIIYGPIDGVTIPKHDRLIYGGVVEHKDLKKVVDNADACCMPFLLNDLILSVDPVKLYEYINFNKNILCVRYPEILRFEKFVYFYDNYDTFKESIENMMATEKVKYSIQERNEFLSENTWYSRVEQIVAIINEINR